METRLLTSPTKEVIATWSSSSSRADVMPPSLIKVFRKSWESLKPQLQYCKSKNAVDGALNLKPRLFKGASCYGEVILRCKRRNVRSNFRRPRRKLKETPQETTFLPLFVRGARFGASKLASSVRLSCCTCPSTRVDYFQPSTFRKS